MPVTTSARDILDMLAPIMGRPRRPGGELASADEAQGPSHCPRSANPSASGSSRRAGPSPVDIDELIRVSGMTVAQGPYRAAGARPRRPAATTWPPIGVLERTCGLKTLICAAFSAFASSFGQRQSNMQETIALLCSATGRKDFEQGGDIVRGLLARELCPPSWTGPSPPNVGGNWRKSAIPHLPRIA